MKRIKFGRMALPERSDRLPPVPDGERMQRVRVGVTGLAAVLLIVALATAITSGVQRTASANRAAVAQAAVVPAPPPPTNVVDQAAEPLAQLGVAPGGTPDKGAKRAR